MRVPHHQTQLPDKKILPRTCQEHSTPWLQTKTFQTKSRKTSKSSLIHHKNLTNLHLPRLMPALPLPSPTHPHLHGALGIAPAAGVPWATPRLFDRPGWQHLGTQCHPNPNNCICVNMCRYEVRCPGPSGKTSEDAMLNRSGKHQNIAKRPCQNPSAAFKQSLISLSFSLQAHRQHLISDIRYSVQITTMVHIPHLPRSHIELCPGFVLRQPGSCVVISSRFSHLGEEIVSSTCQYCPDGCHFRASCFEGKGQWFLDKLRSFRKAVEAQ